MQYVDGFVIVVPKKNLKTYIQMAKKAGKMKALEKRLRKNNESTMIE